MTMAFRVASRFSAIDGAPLTWLTAGRVAAAGGESKIPTAAPLSKSSRRLGSILVGFSSSCAFARQMPRILPLCS